MSTSPHAEVSKSVARDDGRSLRRRIGRSTWIVTPCAVNALTIASMSWSLPPRTTGQPPACALTLRNSPNAAVTGASSGSIACEHSPAMRAFPSGVEKRLAKCTADGRPLRPNRAIVRGLRGGDRSGASTDAARPSESLTSAVNRRRYVGPSTPSDAAVCSTDPSTLAAAPPSNGWAIATSGFNSVTASRTSGNARKNGEIATIDWMVEQTSCRKPGSVSSSVRHPPPGVEAPSKTSTESPACASVRAAASPFGPDPTMIASSGEPAELTVPAPCAGSPASRWEHR